jgi:hypothetical protein
METIEFGPYGRWKKIIECMRKMETFAVRINEKRIRDFRAQFQYMVPFDVKKNFRTKRIDAQTVLIFPKTELE